MKPKIHAILSILLTLSIIFGCVGCLPKTSPDASSAGSSSTSSGAAANTNAPSSDSVVQVRLTNATADDHPVAETQRWFAEQLEERSNGRFQCTVFGNGQLAASDREGIEIVINGTVDVGAGSIFTMAALAGDNANELAFLELAMLFDTLSELYEFMDTTETGDELLQILRDSLGVNIAPGGFAQGTEAIISKVPVKVPDDIKGLKLRTPGGVNGNILMEVMGATPLAMSFGELYSAIQQGVVDGSYSNVHNFVYQKIYEVANNAVILDTKANLFGIVYNDDFYEGLPDDLKVIFDETIVDYTIYARKQFEAANEICKEELIEKCDFYYDPTGADLELWRAKCEDAWGNAIDTMGYDFFEKAMKDAGKSIPEQYQR